MRFLCQTFYKKQFFQNNIKIEMRIYKIKFQKPRKTKTNQVLTSIQDNIFINYTLYYFKNTIYDAQIYISKQT